MKTPQRLQQKDGYVMIITLAIVFIISLIGTSLYRFCKSDIDILGNQLASVHAHNAANAGMKYGIRKLGDWMEASDLNKLEDTSSLFPITAPADAEFEDITELRLIDSANDDGNNFVFALTVTGKHENATASVTATFKRNPAFALGIFGDVSVDIKPNASIYSYNACDGDTPSADNSSGQADIGSNNDITVGQGATTDGEVVLGEDGSGNESDCKFCDSSDVTSLGEVIDPDPLDILNGGKMSQMFTHFSGNNSNSYNSVIVDNTVSLRLTGRNSQTEITFETGNYYLEEFSMVGGVLKIDSSNGPVNFFLTGPMNIWPGGYINTSGDPTDFMIYSDSSETIQIQPRGDFSGIIIAPDAEVRVKPNGDFKGTIWASEASIYPGGDVYVDTCLQDRLLKKELEMVSWKENRSN